MSKTIRLSVRLPEELHAAAKEKGSIVETICKALEAYTGVYREGSNREFTVRPGFGGVGKPKSIFLSTPHVEAAEHLVKSGKHIQAIKLIRSVVGCSLHEAKSVADTIRDELKS